MFKWLNKQGVESSEGFSVQSIDRFTIEYKESNKCISLFVERGILPDGRVCIYIAPEAFRQWDNGELIPEVKKVDILKKFNEAMEYQQIAVFIG